MQSSTSGIISTLKVEHSERYSVTGHRNVHTCTPRHTQPLSVTHHSLNMSFEDVSKFKVIKTKYKKYYKVKVVNSIGLQQKQMNISSLIDQTSNSITKST